MTSVNAVTLLSCFAVWLIGPLLIRGRAFADPVTSVATPNQLVDALRSGDAYIRFQDDIDLAEVQEDRDVVAVLFTQTAVVYGHCTKNGTVDTSCTLTLRTIGIELESEFTQKIWIHNMHIRLLPEHRQNQSVSSAPLAILTASASTLLWVTDTSLVGDGVTSARGACIGGAALFQGCTFANFTASTGAALRLATAAVTLHHSHFWLPERTSASAVHAEMPSRVVLTNTTFHNPTLSPGAALSQSSNSDRSFYTSSPMPVLDIWTGRILSTAPLSDTPADTPILSTSDPWIQGAAAEIGINPPAPVVIARAPRTPLHLSNVSLSTTPRRGSAPTVVIVVATLTAAATLLALAAAAAAARHLRRHCRCPHGQPSTTAGSTIASTAAASTGSRSLSTGADSLNAPPPRPASSGTAGGITNPAALYCQPGTHPNSAPATLVFPRDPRQLYPAASLHEHVRSCPAASTRAVEEPRWAEGRSRSPATAAAAAHSPLACPAIAAAIPAAYTQHGSSAPLSRAPPARFAPSSADDLPSRDLDRQDCVRLAAARARTLPNACGRSIHTTESFARPEVSIPQMCPHLQPRVPLQPPEQPLPFSAVSDLRSMRPHAVAPASAAASLPTRTGTSVGGVAAPDADHTDAAAPATAAAAVAAAAGHVCAAAARAAPVGTVVPYPGQLVERVARLQDALDYACENQELFIGRYRVLDSRWRRYGGQGLVQFLQSLNSSDGRSSGEDRARGGGMYGGDFIVKFFDKVHTWEAEVALYVYLARTARTALPLVAQADRNADGGYRCGNGYEWPPFVVLERGESLVEWTQRRALDTPAAVLVLCHLAQRLAALHLAGVSHRDVKPANVLWRTRTHEWTLIDFGCAARIGADAPLAFSLHYAAPEVVAAAEARAARMRVSAAPDMWALGVVAYELLTKTRAFPPGACTGEVCDRVLGRQPLPWEDSAAADAAAEAAQTGGCVSARRDSVGRCSGSGEREGRPLLLLRQSTLHRSVLQCLSRDPTQRPAALEVLAAWDRVFEASTGTRTGLVS